MLAEGEGRKDAATDRLSGRARDHRLVHVARPQQAVRPGDMVTSVVTHAAPHHLVADTLVGVRATRGGDAWAARQAGPSVPAVSSGVSLGMPGIGVGP